MFSCEYFEIFKNSFFIEKPLVSAFGMTSVDVALMSLFTILNIYLEFLFLFQPYLGWIIMAFPGLGEGLVNPQNF